MNQPIEACARHHRSADDRNGQHTDGDGRARGQSIRTPAVIEANRLPVNGTGRTPRPARVASVADARDDDSAGLCNQRTATNTIIIAPTIRVAEHPDADHGEVEMQHRDRDPHDGSTRAAAAATSPPRRARPGPPRRPRPVRAPRRPRPSAARRSKPRPRRICSSSWRTEMCRPIACAATTRPIMPIDHGGSKERIALQVTGSFGDAKARTGVADVAALDERRQPLRHGHRVHTVGQMDLDDRSRAGRTSSTRRRGTWMGR